MILGLAALAVAGLLWWMSAPAPHDPALITGLTPDAANGARVFTASGCASCHTAPGSEQSETPVLAGGQRFVTQFGTFVAPNISSHGENGLGNWTQAQFADAVLKGVSPEGQHYYPAFPYTAYGLMTGQDVVDLWAYMQTLPASDVESVAHDIGFPFNMRRPLGLWKALNTPDGFQQPASTATEERGRYLVEALAHCAECHTPRNALGGLDRAAWMAGAANPSGSGRIPALTPDVLRWSEIDIAYYLETGFTPDFDSVGGHMAAVVRNFAKLPASDRQAVAAYIKALPQP